MTFILFQCVVFSQSHTLRGVVYDKETNERLSSANVLLYSRANKLLKFTTTDKEEKENNGCSSNENNINNLKLYEELGFGTISRTAAENIKDLEEEYSEAWVREALKEADYKGKRNLDYVQGILKNWKVTGIKKSKDKDNSSSNNQNSYRNPKPTEVFNSQMYEELNPNEEIPDYDTVYRETCERMRRKREAEYKKKQITT